MGHLSRAASHASHQCRSTSGVASVVTESLEQKPNRLTFYFAKMKETCPEAIKEYARCVTSANDNEALTRGSCQEEFGLVKACFRQQRREAKY
mmetsp:Transcript_14752/g.19286  ORF Transcript_14752/g.19286 Transcript_14752/m.19286 type:complete len:93 (-) Transcript_14752:1146-1424(-)